VCLTCDKHEEHAINYLLENADELDGSGLVSPSPPMLHLALDIQSFKMAQVSNESDQVPSPNHATSEISSHAPASTVSKSSKDTFLSVEEGPALQMSLLRSL
jgi:hypothetical protein